MTYYWEERQLVVYYPNAIGTRGNMVTMCVWMIPGTYCS
jgi:hypothetical protein